MTEPVSKTKIRGDFHGYSPGIVFELADGTLWQQVDGPSIPVYLYRPAVTVQRRDDTHSLEVEGMGEAVQVCEVDSRWVSSRPMPLYRWNGDFYGFVYREGFFSTEGAYLGWVDEDDLVWHADGTFWGEVFRETHVVRYRDEDDPDPQEPREPIAPPDELPKGATKPPRTEHADMVDALSD